MTRFRSQKKNDFLQKIPHSSLIESDTASRCSFCLSFLDVSQEAGQSPEDWEAAGGATSSLNLLNKLKEYSRDSLEYWLHVDASTFVIYGSFPSKSDFVHPKHVPHDVRWARFRLGNKIRLAGFVVPDELHSSDVTVKGQQFKLYKNIFYVVFLDREHKFYKTEPP